MKYLLTLLCIFFVSCNKGLYFFGEEEEENLKIPPALFFPKLPPPTPLSPPPPSPPSFSEPFPPLLPSAPPSPPVYSKPFPKLPPPPPLSPTPPSPPSFSEPFPSLPPPAPFSPTPTSSPAIEKSLPPRLKVLKVPDPLLEDSLRLNLPRVKKHILPPDPPVLSAPSLPSPPSFEVLPMPPAISFVLKPPSYSMPFSKVIPPSPSSLPSPPVSFKPLPKVIPPPPLSPTPTSPPSVFSEPESISANSFSKVIPSLPPLVPLSPPPESLPDLTKLKSKPPANPLLEKSLNPKALIFEVKENTAPPAPLVLSPEPLLPVIPPSRITFTPPVPSPPPVPPPAPSPVFIPPRPLDILFVIDTSASMIPHLREFNKKFIGFLEHFVDLDWQLALTNADYGETGFFLFDLGALKGEAMLLEKRGQILNLYYLKPETPDYNQIFLDSISIHKPEEYKTKRYRGRDENLDPCQLPPFCQSLQEQPLKSLKFALAKNEDFFRKEADLAVVIISNSKEKGGDLMATEPEEVVEQFKEIHSRESVGESVGESLRDKRFEVYGIIIDDIDCLNQNQGQQFLFPEGDFSDKIADLSTITGGKVFSICAPHYQELAQSIFNSFGKPQMK